MSCLTQKKNCHFLVALYSGILTQTMASSAMAEDVNVEKFLDFVPSRLVSVQDFLIKLDIKPLMHLLEMSTLSLNIVIVRLTKIMNRANKYWAHF